VVLWLNCKVCGVKVTCGVVGNCKIGGGQVTYDVVRNCK
jgi:hypothetical protein